LPQPKFTITRKGYVPADVDSYVSRVLDELSGVRDDLAKAQDQLDNAQSDLTATQEELAGAQTELTDLRGDFDAVKQQAEDAAAVTLEEAKRKADEILQAAETGAEEIRETMAREEQEMQERLRTRENEITAELDAIDASVSERNQAIAKLEVRLEAEEARYGDRIGTLRNLAESLEEALKSLMAGSLVELGVYLETHQAAVVDNDVVGAAVHHHYTTDALLAASPPTPGRTSSEAPGFGRGSGADSGPDVGPDDVGTRDWERSDVEEDGSFYSRRSAHLPSIGDDKGQSVLAAMNAIRTDGHDEDEDEQDGDEG
jgi:cell division septum initiation protein DivIVA